MSKIILVVGATASGKSQIAVNLAKITLEEMQGIKHHLIDVVNAESDFSVGEYTVMADEAIDDILSREKTPIVVGGTGLYVDGILYPMTFGGDKNILIRQELEKELELYGKDA